MADQTPETTRWYSTSPHPLYVQHGDPLTPGARYEITGEPVGSDAAHIAEGRLAPDVEPEPTVLTVAQLHDALKALGVPFKARDNQETLQALLDDHDKQGA